METWSTPSEMNELTLDRNTSRFSDFGGASSQIQESSNILPDSNVGYSVGVEEMIPEDSRECVVGDARRTLSLCAVILLAR